MLELLYRNKIDRLDGMSALIVSPTRELAYQTYSVLQKIGSEHDVSAGLVIGGKVSVCVGYCVCARLRVHVLVTVCACACVGYCVCVRSVGYCVCVRMCWLLWVCVCACLGQVKSNLVSFTFKLIL